MTEGGASATSAPDGTVVLELQGSRGTGAPGGGEAREVKRPAEWSAELVVSHPSHARRFLRVGLTEGGTVHLGDVELAPAGALAGRVVDELGHPRGGVRVLVAPVEHLGEDPEKCRRHGPGLAGPGPSATSGADGGFRLEELPVGHLRLWAGRAGLAWSTRGPLEVREGETTEILVTVEALREDDFLRGVVRSPDDEPVVGAGVRWWYTAGHVGTGGQDVTGADGAFAILVDHRVPHDLTVSDPEDRWSDVRLRAEPGVQGLVVAFREPRWLTVRLAGQVAPPSFLLSAVDGPSGGADRLERVQVPAGVRTTRIRVPEQPIWLVPRARGFMASRLGPYDPEALPAEVELELHPLPGVRGRVLMAGKTVAGASVSLRCAARPGEKLLANGFPSLFQPYDEDAVTADGEGRFLLHVEEAGPYVIRAELADEATAYFGPLELDPALGAEDLEVELLALGAIAGHVRVAPGGDPDGLILGYHRGDGQPRTLRLGHGGEYFLEGLIPGPWQVRLVDEEILPGDLRLSFSGDSSGEPVAFDCEVLPGEVTRFDLDLSAGLGATVRGRLRLAGQGAAGWTASLVDRSEPLHALVLATAVLGADGGFALAGRGPGRCVLELVAPAGPNGRLVLSEELALGADELVWDVDFAPAAVEGTGAPAETGSERLLEYRFQGQVGGRTLSGLVRILSDAGGSFRLDPVPPGPARIAAYAPPREGGLPGEWVDVAEFAAVAGETFRVQLP